MKFWQITVLVAACVVLLVLGIKFIPQPSPVTISVDSAVQYEGELTIKVASNSPAGLVTPGGLIPAMFFDLAASSKRDVKLSDLAVRVLMSDGATPPSEVLLAFDDTGTIISRYLDDQHRAVFDKLTVKVPQGKKRPVEVLLNLPKDAKKGSTYIVIIADPEDVETRARLTNSFPVSGKELRL